MAFAGQPRTPTREAQRQPGAAGQGEGRLAARPLARSRRAKRSGGTTMPVRPRPRNPTALAGWSPARARWWAPSAGARKPHSHGAEMSTKRQARAILFDSALRSRRRKGPSNGASAPGNAHDRRRPRGAALLEDGGVLDGLRPVLALEVNGLARRVPGAELHRESGCSEAQAHARLTCQGRSLPGGVGSAPVLCLGAGPAPIASASAAR
jgi:hypothetical protein